MIIFRRAKYRDMKTSDSKPTSIDHLKAILALPFMVLVVIPGLIQYFSKENSNYLFDKIAFPFSGIFGFVLLAIGLFLFTQSILLFIKIGNGTLAPWNPTKKLVVKSLYRHVRNPMILGVVIILLAESFLLKSAYILAWAILFFFINCIYFIFKEEPDLEKRFGEEYRDYKKNVPRWLLRIKGWRPEEDGN